MIKKQIQNQNANPNSKFLSDIYPGTLRMIKNKYGAEVGIEGNIT